LTDILKILDQYWGYPAFREQQAEVIGSVIKGNDTLALMPTGGGKSLTYQLPAMAQDGLCIVVTPLIALMNDQVTVLKNKSIKAVALHSGLDYREIDVMLDSCIYGKVKFLYCSPERLQTTLFQERVVQMKVNLIAVDEAHCISQWGHDFRPSYLEIAELRNLLPNVPLLAVTATATPKVREEIIEKLRLRHVVTFQHSFLRPNLSLSVRRVEDKNSKLFEILTKISGSTIVYVKTRRLARELTQNLQRNGITSNFYHAGLPSKERLIRQNNWRDNKFRVMVATNAFGMGIDKADVRLVIHMGPPGSIEAYYQEAGRAGRDGKKAYAVLLIQGNDASLLKDRLSLAHPKIKELKHLYQCLANYYKLAVGSGEMQSFDFDLEEFSGRFGLDRLAVFYGLKRLSEDGLISYTDTVFEPSKIKLTVNHDQLYKFQVANSRYDLFIKALLRLYGGQLFSEFIRISEHKISGFFETGQSEVVNLLNKLNELDILSYLPKSEGGSITLLKPRQAVQSLTLNTQRLRQLQVVDADKVEAVINYFTHSDHCRMTVILNYFGEQSANCGICDVCLANREAIDDSAMIKVIREQIQRTPLSIEEVVNHFKESHRQQVLQCIRQLLDEGDVIQNDENKLSPG
jgi:ATP-dependent DNA helicase RecQ